MSLFEWGNGDIEADVRTVLKAHGAADLSTAACRSWARAFVQRYVPRWLPGTPLDANDAIAVGERFVEELIVAKRELRYLREA